MMSISNCCPRCKKPSDLNELCSYCRSELLSKYNNKISWDKAYEIEKDIKPYDEFENFF